MKLILPLVTLAGAATLLFNSWAAASLGYLRKRRTGAQFANPQEITKALGGKGSAAGVLEDIKEPQPAGPPVAGVNAPPDPNYNVDLDGDGTNDAYVEPMVMNGVNVSKAIGGPGEIGRASCRERVYGLV